tara:strand:- start:1508 stop:1945 length:438 start_codon:yes stop_codon:yes gene_type:complete
MYSSFGKGITIFYTVLLFIISCQPTIAVAKADQHKRNSEVKLSTLSAQPDQCVTLRQGRDCFATIKLQWKTPLKQAVCLFQKGQQRKIKCWDNHDHGDMFIEFESNESINYQLRTLKGNRIIIQTQIKVSWLHKSSARKRRWRLF